MVRTANHRKTELPKEGTSTAETRGADAFSDGVVRERRSGSNWQVPRPLVPKTLGLRSCENPGFIQ